MAILHNGLFGRISGKLGNTVIYTSFDKMVVRMKGKRSKPPTELELANWKKMAVVSEFLGPLKPFVKMGFAEVAKSDKMFPYHKAVSLNKKYALKGEYPELEMDYTKACLSQGDLPGLSSLTVLPDANGLKFSWEAGQWSPQGGSAMDQVMLMAYFPDIPMGSPKFKRAYFELAGARRDKGFDVLELPAELLTMRTEVYVAVVANDRKRICNSIYLGRLN